MAPPRQESTRVPSPVVRKSLSFARWRPKPGVRDRGPPRYSSEYRTGARATQEFLLDGREEAVETFDGMPAGFKYLSEEDRAQFAKQPLEQKLQKSKVALKRKRADDLVQGYRALQELGVHLDGRTLIELRDNVTILNRQDVVVNDAVAVAVPLLEDSSTPTYELDAEHRGEETGIVLVSNKIGIRVPPNMSGVVGKLMKKLYIKRYDLPADFNAFIKRQTLLNGCPISEYTYYKRDEDIIEEAIREVMKSVVKPRQSATKTLLNILVKR